MSRARDPDATNEAARLAALVEQIEKRDAPADLLALATEIDELGHRVALTLSEASRASDLGLASSLRPVLLGVPVAYTQTLLRASEMYDDAGSPRRAVFALVAALRRAFEANLVEVVGGALAFLLETHDQPASASLVREILRASEEEGVSRRELRQRYLASLEPLRGLIDWEALEDELDLSRS